MQDAYCQLAIHMRYIDWAGAVVYGEPSAHYPSAMTYMVGHPICMQGGKIDASSRRRVTALCWLVYLRALHEAWCWTKEGTNIPTITELLLLTCAGNAEQCMISGFVGVGDTRQDRKINLMKGKDVTVPYKVDLLDWPCSRCEQGR